jgi:hypothetical protein
MADRQTTQKYEKEVKQELARIKKLQAAQALNHKQWRV